MVESSRFSTNGNREVHLKSRLQVTKELINDVGLPLPLSEWVVAVKDVDGDEWIEASEYPEFKDADLEFINKTESEINITSVKRLSINGNRVIKDANSN